MKELHEHQIKELTETPLTDGNFSSELSRQEADDKVAALLEERHLLEQAEKLGVAEGDIGLLDTNRLADLKRDADKAQAKYSRLDKELKDLKSRRQQEKNPVKIRQIEKEIADKKSALKAAKDNYDDKINAYTAYIRRNR